MNQQKKIVFLTGTRADFGKLKSLIEVLGKSEYFEVHIFATGMHMDVKYGYTVNEIVKYGYQNIYRYINHDSESLMDITLSRTIEGFANYIRMIEPDLIVVHGDRIEALAGATVGALNNILVAHIEGGELSGTVDELVRHAVSKLSHTHFVANADAARRLEQMGEVNSSIFVIGSPDMDVMLSDHLPSIGEVKAHYNIPFGNYAVSLFHSVTTEVDQLTVYAENYFNALESSGVNYIIVYPNNDKGAAAIMQQVNKIKPGTRYKIFPSIRFESFLSLLKHAQFIIGNSSAGIREAPYYGVPTINVGSRQYNRTSNTDIIHTSYETASIKEAIEKALSSKIGAQQLYGTGNSDIKFFEILNTKGFWSIKKQKAFKDA
ncbi:MAG TPA: UDP-N-acetylglucosamine 2-epimerase [Panacibacter sp.]|nr:UDP-N-acetylglucosamine 2-epimerase [Panacibacter sp.]